MKKNVFEKKEYIKAEIEFVEFDYSAVCSASVGEAGDDDEDEDFDVPNTLTSMLGFAPKSVQSAAPSTAVEAPEGDMENTEDGALGLFGLSSDEGSNDTDTAEADGGFFDALGDVVSGNEAIEGGGDNGGAADDGGGDFSSGDTSGDTSSSGDSVWTE